MIGSKDAPELGFARVPTCSFDFDVGLFALLLCTCHDPKTKANGASWKVQEVALEGSAV